MNLGAVETLWDTDVFFNYLSILVTLTSTRTVRVEVNDDEELSYSEYIDGVIAIVIIHVYLTWEGGSGVKIRPN